MKMEHQWLVLLKTIFKEYQLTTSDWVIVLHSSGLLQKSQIFKEFAGEYNE